MPKYYAIRLPFRWSLTATQTILGQRSHISKAPPSYFNMERWEWGYETTSKAPSSYFNMESWEWDYETTYHLSVDFRLGSDTVLSSVYIVEQELAFFISTVEWERKPA